MFDVRAIANFVLDLAAKRDVEVSNMALNKLVYFVHCDYLLERSEPLVGAKIEAWEHGPVFRELYHEFKQWHDSPIYSRATKIDVESGNSIQANAEMDAEIAAYISTLVDRYLHFSASQLRAISHREGGPWSQVWGHVGRSNPGMKISNELIVECYSPEVLQ